MIQFSFFVVEENKSLSDGKKKKKSRPNFSFMIFKVWLVAGVIC